MTPRLPLTALLSRALVAFTIEFDNEFEHRMQHRITRGAAGGAQRGPWLVSMVMWLNCMRFVGEQPVAVSEVERLARTRTNLDGMRRWGYVALEPRAAGRAGASRAGATIRATRWGLLARKVWRPLAGEVEDRWRERFGADRVARLREPLAALAASAPAEWPDCMPILGYGLSTRARLRPGRPAGEAELPPEPGPSPNAGLAPGPGLAVPGTAPPAPGTGPPDGGLPLPVLLARVLIGFAVQYEEHPGVSLAIGANVLRVLDEAGVRRRDLPARSGVSAEAVSMALGVLGKRDLAVTGPDPAGGRGITVRLTPAGRAAQQACQARLARIEQEAAERFAAAVAGALRAALEDLGAGLDGGPSPLLRGLEPYPDGWRATVRRPQVLPHYPMVLHRGGYPDGS